MLVRPLAVVLAVCAVGLVGVTGVALVARPALASTECTSPPFSSSHNWLGYSGLAPQPKTGNPTGLVISNEATIPHSAVYAQCLGVNTNDHVDIVESLMITAGANGGVYIQVGWARDPTLSQDRFFWQYNENGINNCYTDQTGNSSSPCQTAFWGTPGSSDSYEITPNADLVGGGWQLTALVNGGSPLNGNGKLAALYTTLFNGLSSGQAMEETVDPNADIPGDSTAKSWINNWELQGVTSSGAVSGWYYGLQGSQGYQGSNLFAPCAVSSPTSTTKAGTYQHFGYNSSMTGVDFYIGTPAHYVQSWINGGACNP